MLNKLAVCSQNSNSAEVKSQVDSWTWKNFEAGSPMLVDMSMLNVAYSTLSNV